MSGIIGVSPDVKSGIVGAYPVGHVIQVVRAQSTSQVTTETNNSINDHVSPVEKSFTLKSTNPMLNVSYLCQTGTTNDTVSWKIEFAWNVNGGSYTGFTGLEEGLCYEYHVELGDTDIRRPKNAHASKVIAATAGQTVIVQAWAYGGHTKATTFAGYHDLTIMEIQQ